MGVPPRLTFCHPSDAGGNNYCPHPKDGEGTVLSLSVHTSMGGGGYPVPGLDGGGVPHPRSGQEGGYPIPGLDGGPHPRSGQRGTPSQVWMGGIPSQVWTEGTPSQVWGYPPARSGWWGYPISGQRVLRVPPWPGLDSGGYLGYPTARSGWWGEHTQGTPQPGLDGGVGVSGVPPSQVWMVGGTRGNPRPGLDGVPPTITGLGTPPTITGWGTPIKQSSIASTCYAAGSMPLAFTQDFLVQSRFENQVKMYTEGPKKKIDERVPVQLSEANPARVQDK